MNNWMKKGMTGMVIAAAALSAPAVSAQISMGGSELVDASELIAGKLKDRMIKGCNSEETNPLFVDASDLIAGKLKDRMIRLS